MLLLSPYAQATIPGISGGAFTFVAGVDHIATGDGGSMLVWAYANAGAPNSRAQYPGPTLILTQGQTVTLTLQNTLDVPTSIVFPGQANVTATGGPNSQDGLLTKEALKGGSVTYTFTASQAGTYTYHSGTNPELQVEMGLVGVIIVRPGTTA